MFGSLILIVSASVVAAQAESEIPKEVQEVIESSVGTWSIEMTIGDSTTKGRSNVRLAPGGHCMIAHLSTKKGDEQVSYSFLSGWDSSTGGFTDQGLSSEGEVWTTRWSVVSPTVCEGEQLGSSEGKKTAAKVRMERTVPGQIVVTITESVKGEEPQPDIKIVYRRLERKKDKAGRSNK